MADVILLQIKYKEKLYEIPADLNSTAVRCSYLKGIDKQAEGLKYINTSGNKRFLRKLGDYIYLPKDEENVSKKIFELVLQSAPDMAPIMSSTRLPENEGKLNFVNNSVALQESFSSNNWKQYFQHFLNVSCANEWNEVTKGRQLAASLKGIALDVQNSLPYEQRWDFSALVNALSYRFASPSTTLARSQFHTAKRRTNEDVIDFANRLRGLLAEAYPSLPSSNAKELLIQQFIDGIADVNIRRHIVANNCLSLKSAVNLVRSLEACEHVALEKPLSSQSHRSYQESSDEVQDLKQMIADLSRAVSNTGLMRDNRRQSDVNNGPLCFDCGLTGHIARSCPSKTSKGFKRTSNNKHLN